MSLVLGISTGILLRDEYNITFSEKSYMLFGNRPCHYHIEDDTEIVCPRFTKGFEVYAGVNSISIDAKTYSSKKGSDYDITIGCLPAVMNIKLKIRGTVFIDCDNMINMEIEGEEGTFNSVSVKDPRKLNVISVKNALVSPLADDDGFCDYYTSPETAMEFVRICNKQGLKLNLNANEIRHISMVTHNLIFYGREKQNDYDKYDFVEPKFNKEFIELFYRLQEEKLKRLKERKA